MKFFWLGLLILSNSACQTSGPRNPSELSSYPPNGCADATAPILPISYWDKTEVPDRCMMQWARKGTWLGSYAPTDTVLQKVKSQLHLMNQEAPYTYTIVSDYRSYQTQIATFQRWKESAECQAYADKERCAWAFSAKPGTSEHQLGVVFDLTSGDLAPFNQGGYGSPFGRSPAGKWLRENAHNYGFTMSYTWGKESIHCYDPEPWHWRYVGKKLATFLKEKNLILDEVFRSEFGAPPHVVDCPVTRADYKYDLENVVTNPGPVNNSPCKESWKHWTTCVGEKQACVNGKLINCEGGCEVSQITPSHDMCRSLTCNPNWIQSLTTCVLDNKAACLEGAVRGCATSCSPQTTGQHDLCD